MQSALIANGNGPSLTLPAGVCCFEAIGNFGGGTLTLQKLPFGEDATQDDNWITVPGVSFTSKSMVIFTVSAGHWRAVLTGATSPAVKYDLTGVLGTAAASYPTGRSV